MKHLQYSILILSIMMMSSCASNDTSLSQTAEKDYKKAERLVANDDFGRAALYLGKFTAKYPYSKFATPAELLRFKTAYLNEEYILSETLSKRFVEAHPNHAERNYAEYILGMSYFHQSESADHEQVFSKKARDSFIALNKRKPDNKYAKEVDKHLNIILNRMAEHELIIGKFYYGKALYIGATNRFIVVKNKFLKTSAAAESLYWLASSYKALQQKESVQQVVHLLNENFSGTKWQKKAKAL
ncbi:MAG: outer membrane protein assembly factor BamD [Ghiorsea sp.]